MRPSNADRSAVIKALEPGGQIFEISQAFTNSSVIPVVTEFHDPNLFLNRTFFRIHSSGLPFEVFESLERCNNVCSRGYIEIDYHKDKQVVSESEFFSLLVSYREGSARL